MRLQSVMSRMKKGGDGDNGDVEINCSTYFVSISSSPFSPHPPFFFCQLIEFSQTYRDTRQFV